MKSREIKNMLAGLALALGNDANNFETGYHTSARGVPYIHVVVNKKRYQVAFFNGSNSFRVFNEKQQKQDIKNRNEVIQFFIDMRDRERMDT